MENYRIINLNDCCFVCKHYYENGFYANACAFNPNRVKKIAINGICDKFERE